MYVVDFSTMVSSVLRLVCHSCNSVIAGVFFLHFFVVSAGIVAFLRNNEVSVIADREPCERVSKATVNCRLV